MAEAAAVAPSPGPPHAWGAPTVASMMRDVVVALVPCALVGAWNVGRQARAALASGAEVATDWRFDLAGRAGEGVLGDFVLGAAFVAPLLAITALACVGWEHAVARWRRRPVGEGAFVTAFILTLLLPPAAPLWQAFAAASFGIVFGKLLFGGTGRNFLNPSVVALAYLAVAHAGPLPGGSAFPGVNGYLGTSAFALAAEGEAVVGSGLAAFLGASPGRIGETSVLACLLGAAWLVARGVASWRIMVSVILGASAVALAFGVLGGEGVGTGLPWHAHLVLGGLAFTAAFVATDPVSAASTPAGRWIYGATVGAVAVLLREANPQHPDGVVAAVLLGNVAAPLIDHVVVRRAVRRRAKRIARAAAGGGHDG